MSRIDLSDHNDPYRHCSLCPRECGVDRTQGSTGICRSDDTPKVARVSLHMWEEPPISGSSGSGMIFFSGCSLGCIYCQNHLISRSSVGERFDEVRLADAMLSLQDQNAMNVNLVTPTHFAPTIRKAITLAKKEGLRIPIVWNTSGYEKMSCIQSNDGLIDIYLSDVKYAENDLAYRYSSAKGYLDHTLNSIDAMLESVGEPTFDTFGKDRRMIKGIIVRHMVLPGEINDSKKVLDALFARYGNSILYSIMNQYTPVLKTLADANDDEASSALKRFSNLGRSVSAEEYEAVLDYADSIGIEDYFWQDGESCKESFIPDFLTNASGR